MALPMLPFGRMGARSDWNVPGADLMASVKPDEKLRFAVKYAELASAHIRWPSWEYRIAGAAAELTATDTPGAHAPDEADRESMIGCGLSLQIFKLTLRHLGCFGRVELFPNLDRPMLAARIHLGQGGERRALEGRLFGAISREEAAPPAADESAADAVMAALGGVADEERGWLEFARAEASRERLQALVGRPQRFEVEAAGASTRFASDRRPRGAGGFLRERFSQGTKLQVKVRSTGTEAGGSSTGDAGAVLGGTLAVLKTKTDDKYGWLAAGQTLGRLMLQAKALGVACSLHDESLHSAQVRAALRTEIGRKGFAQAILRFGIESPRAANVPVVLRRLSPSPAVASLTAEPDAMAVSG